MPNITYVNLDLLSVGFAVAAIAILGFVIFFNNRESITSKYFLLFCLSAVAWSSVNYISYRPYNAATALWVVRAVMFFGVWLVFFLYSLLYVFPETKKSFTKKYKSVILPGAIVTSILALTPFVFSKIEKFSETGIPERISIGLGIPVYGIYILSIVIASIVIFGKKIILASQKDRSAFLPVLVGIVITFLLLLSFNFILPAFFSTPQFVPMGGLFFLPFIVCTAYAIFKHRLLNTKLISTEILVFTLAIVSFFEIIVSPSITVTIFRLVVFLLILSIGILLIRSVVKEVKQRELLEVLSKQLATANEQLKALDQARADFITIASHQLRTPPATIKWYLSAIKSGDYGTLPAESLEAITRAEATNNSLISLIDDLLNASRIERGKMEFAFSETNVEELAQLTVDQLKPLAGMKGLHLVYEKPSKPLPTIMSDKEKLRQVMNNFIDNAIKYTSHGNVIAKLFEENGNIRFQVTDSGKGIGKEFVGTIFQKYTRGKDSATHSTGLGLGLYVAKVIIGKHKGDIWAESPGENQGSTFIFTVPIHNGLSGTDTLDLSDRTMANLSDGGEAKT